MNILSIETSCDETAVSIVNASGDFPHAAYEVLGNALYSQADIHSEYGGVFPSVAKREHAKTLVPMLTAALEESGQLDAAAKSLTKHETEIIESTLQREPELAEALTSFLGQYNKPAIDLISVTAGPGLEPALWVGVNFARTLAQIWNIPVVDVNHMEGHILSSIFDGKTIPEIVFPALALLISGGHTELVLMKDWATYERVGETRDDAVGEAFDKVARMLGLPYPGGPKISNLAMQAREEKLSVYTKLPAPMIDSGDLDFSFSGLKTAVRYAIEGKELNDQEKKSLARDFEDVVTEVLIKKTTTAIDEYDIQTLIVGGGVAASSYIKSSFLYTIGPGYPTLTIYFPDPSLSTDNSVMIALAGHARMAIKCAPKDTDDIRADGNRSLQEEK